MGTLEPKLSFFYPQRGVFSFNMALFFELMVTKKEILPGKGFSGDSAVKNPQGRSYRRCRFYPWFGKIPQRRAWQSTSVFLPGESHGQRILAGSVHRVAKTQT